MPMTVAMFSSAEIAHHPSTAITGTLGTIVSSPKRGAEHDENHCKHPDELRREAAELRDHEVVIERADSRP